MLVGPQRVLGLSEERGSVQEAREGWGADSERAERMGVKGHGRAVFLAEAGKGRVPGKDGGARAGLQRMRWLGGRWGRGGGGRIRDMQGDGEA